MDIALFAYDGIVTPLMVECLESLRRHSDCKIIFYGKVDHPDLLPVVVTPFPSAWTDRRMTERMYLARQTGVYGDQVLLLDTDMVFRGNPFEVFDLPFDMCYTTRPFKNTLSPVNGGFNGWRVSPRTHGLWTWMVNQAEHPDWPHYLQVRQKLLRVDRQAELDWWSHQDLLCAMHKAPALPFLCNFRDVGSNYNWCPDSGGGRALTEEAKERFFRGCQNPDVVVIHYKELKYAVQPADFTFR